jgi:glycosidase
MPRFNHFNPEVVAYLTEAALFWLDLDSDGDYTDGVDGFRVDNVTFPPQEFFIALRQGIKNANPDALLLGEAWVHTTSDLSRYFENQFDALFDFPFYELLQGNHDSNGDGLLANKGFPALLSILMKEEAERYQDEQIAVRFLSNHDTNRIATELGRDPDRARLAATLLAALKGPVMLYYGEEIGMPGQKGGPPHWDSYRREPMDWYAEEEGTGQTTWFQPVDGWNQPRDGISVEEQDGAVGSLLTYYRQAFEIRQTSPALHKGDFAILDLEVSAPGPWGFLRTYEDSVVLALYNFAEEAREVTIEDFPFTEAAMVDLLTGQAYPSVEAGGVYALTLPPASALLLAGSDY